MQVRIGSPSGPPMTGFEPGNGGADTGDWVTNGLVFVLVNSSGNEVARAIAKVDCRAASANLNEQLATQSYFPLEVGNRWIYRASNRLATAYHVVQWIDRTVERNGEIWYVLSEGSSAKETLYRADAQGRIYRLNVNGSPQLFLDPNANSDPSAALRIQQRNVTLNTPFGSVTNALNYTQQFSLILEAGTMAKGIGLIANSQTMQTGSSGGFSSSLVLVEAVIAGKVRFSSPANGLELSPESQTLNLTSRQARNCALPCYFVACGLGGGQPDPPGTYKPCMFTRLKVENPAARSLSLELINPASVAVHTVTRTLTVSPSEQLWFETVPLYTAPNPTPSPTPSLGPIAVLPPGAYQLKATVKSADGQTLNTSTATVKID